LIEKTNGSKVMETELSRVRARTEIKFFIRCGEIRTVSKCKGVEEVVMTEESKCDTSKRAPLPMMIDVCKGGGEEEVSILE
jgi:hypothetical protein